MRGRQIAPPANMIRERDDGVTEATGREGGTARGDMLAALRIRNYRLYFYGQLVSNSGTWMQRIAQDWFVLELADSQTAVGTAIALQFLPTLVFSGWVGAYLDRFSKRVVLIATQVALAGCAGILGVLTVSGVATLEVVYLLALAVGIVSVFDTPTRQVFVHDIVPEQILRNAISLNIAVFQIARLVGPVAAGALIGLFGIGSAFLLNAGSYLATIAALLLMDPSRIGGYRVRNSMRGRLARSLRYLRSQPQIACTLAVVFVIGTFTYNFSIYMSEYARDILAGDALTYGYLNAALAAGAIGGAAWSASRLPARSRSAMLSAGTLGVAMVGTAWSPDFWPVVGGLVVCGFAVTSFNTNANTSTQLSCTAEMRTDVMSIYVGLYMGGKPFGSPLVGMLTDAFGVQVSMSVIGLLTAAVAAAALIASQTHRPARGQK